MMPILSRISIMRTVKQTSIRSANKLMRDYPKKKSKNVWRRRKDWLMCWNLLNTFLRLLKLESIIQNMLHVLWAKFSIKSMLLIIPFSNVLTVLLIYTEPHITGHSDISMIEIYMVKFPHIISHIADYL